MSRHILFLASAATVVCVLTASAASLSGLSAAGLAAGGAAVSACDADGVSVSYTVNGSVVESMTVSGVATACTNGSLRAVLANSSGVSVGSGGPVAVASSSVVVPLSPQPLASGVAAVHVSVVGP